MTIKRRQLLQIAGLGWAANPLRNLAADSAADADLQLLVVNDGQALPLFAPGDLLLADTLDTAYSGEGIYFYPHWGQPRPYLVNLITSPLNEWVLEFRNPANQQLLWTQSFALDSRFAGRLKAHFPNAQAVSETGAYSRLTLPALPPSIDSRDFNFNIPTRV